MLDFWTRLPSLIQGGILGPDPMNLNSQTLYSSEMDRWILNNKVVFENW